MFSFEWIFTIVKIQNQSNTKIEKEKNEKISIYWKKTMIQRGVIFLGLLRHVVSEKIVEIDVSKIGV